MIKSDFYSFNPQSLPLPWIQLTNQLNGYNVLIIRGFYFFLFRPCSKSVPCLFQVETRENKGLFQVFQVKRACVYVTKAVSKNK